MPLDPEDSELTFVCPNCRKHFKENWGRISRRCNLTCAACGAQTLLHPAEIRRLRSLFEKGFREPSLTLAPIKIVEDD